MGSLYNFCLIHINSTQNNTILTATDLKGNLIDYKTLGTTLKSKRGKRSVPQGALLSGEGLGTTLVNKGYSSGQLRVKGFGNGRENAIQGLSASGFQILEILDITKIPHNGCRPRKARRL
jgi:small subunit ribosomal protein S11